MKKIIFAVALLCALPLFADEKSNRIADLNASKDAATIINAADWLGKNGDEDAVQPLVNLLTDSRKDVRLHAVMALGNLGKEKGAAGVNSRILNDPSSDVRYAAVLASFRIASPSSLVIWQQANEKETDPFIKDIFTKLTDKFKK